MTSSPIVIADTREQLPYSFPQEWRVIRKKLDSGDYSIFGHEHCFAIERKSLEDLLGCLFTDRFHNELRRLQGYAQAFLVIEANIWKIRNARKFSKVNPESVLGMLQKISLRPPAGYGIQVCLWDDRGEAEGQVKGLIEKYHKSLLQAQPTGKDGN